MTETPVNAPQAEAKQLDSKRELPPAAQRALAEAAARRAAIDAAARLPPEHHGRGGLEPVRYGDWEIKGIAADF
ncbi:DUF1674 domain-containing protein [Blastochloris sulfoviridis]|uniref:DUF1674 domain-containing protein n=1 Tax=Blastochloris sulfoviridis TaxID=50712 RepID=A0A5M6I6F1_9HYPH|nr:DUF1674 domain-containing protein [Blastochloris sulfoviridis]KAA5603319.1 DUF1674 domain-containing protein [Blastochloris sulfoviridis]